MGSVTRDRKRRAYDLEFEPNRGRPPVINAQQRRAYDLEFAPPVEQRSVDDYVRDAMATPAPVPAPQLTRERRKAAKKEDDAYIKSRTRADVKREKQKIKDDREMLGARHLDKLRAARKEADEKSLKSRLSREKTMSEIRENPPLLGLLGSSVPKARADRRQRIQLEMDEAIRDAKNRRDGVFDPEVQAVIDEHRLAGPQGPDLVEQMRQQMDQMPGPMPPPQDPYSMGQQPRTMAPPPPGGDIAIPTVGRQQPVVPSPREIMAKIGPRPTNPDDLAKWSRDLHQQPAVRRVPRSTAGSVPASPQYKADAPRPQRAPGLIDIGKKMARYVRGTGYAGASGPEQEAMHRVAIERFKAENPGYKLPVSDAQRRQNEKNTQIRARREQGRR